MGLRWLCAHLAGQCVELLLTLRNPIPTSSSSAHLGFTLIIALSFRTVTSSFTTLSSNKRAQEQLEAERQKSEANRRAREEKDRLTLAKMHRDQSMMEKHIEQLKGRLGEWYVFVCM
jgi:hypothetical protein